MYLTASCDCIDAVLALLFEERIDRVVGCDDELGMLECGLPSFEFSIGGILV